MDEFPGYQDLSNKEFYYGVKIYDEIISPSPKKTGGLYLGRVHFLKRRQEMKSLGIGAILSVIEMPIALEKEDNFTHMYIEIEDDSDCDLSVNFDKTFEFLEDNLKKTSVYVHCQMGISRSSTIVLAYLMKKRNLSFDEAKAFLTSKRECVDPNAGFVHQLMNYEIKLNEQKKK